ncbi:AMFR protein-like protein [Cucurbitaria berberidis CBS 394.84]|uniref:Coupling of ubiquitin conjugation to ER degradation protein 1 n=1 Tax=Cucurbitaria berberidis CBS 394.84 TaxID=1168544 RepID=A0A9P4L6Q6_9PLEO|nr:AMFR protein-like protein [Cucurbitaria berberidis CBS 394.84]KAF1843592.1 AMFR protein-like protein [Cucurbitaria berberidis CBS 394.84]
MAEQSINIPQVLVFIVVTFLAVRWYLSKPSTEGTRAATANRSGSAPRINPAQIHQVADMFPHLSRRDIGWDLQRNGGNLTATTERVLSGRGLDSAPASFVLPEDRRTAQPARTATPVAKPVHPDLITKYNLSTKLSQTAQPTDIEQPKVKSWSQDRNERQANLQRRREEMILAARRKLEEKEKAKASGATA